MATDIIVGEPKVKARVQMRNKNGQPTLTYDVAGGIEWTSSDDTKAAAVDDDADPHDARIDILDKTEPGSPVRIGVSFDGDPGDGVRMVEAEAEINVIDGQATGAEIFIDIVEEPPA